MIESDDAPLRLTMPGSPLRLANRGDPERAAQIMRAKLGSEIRWSVPFAA